MLNQYTNFSRKKYFTNTHALLYIHTHTTHTLYELIIVNNPYRISSKVYNLYTDTKHQ